VIQDQNNLIMVEFEGPKVTLGITPSELNTKFQDLSSVGKLLPPDSVKDFAADGNTCSFKVKGGVEIHLVKDTISLEGDLILKMNTVAPTPVKFSLEVLASDHESGCTCYVRSEADLNPFTRMMVEPALKSLFEDMAKGMQSQFPA